MDPSSMADLPLPCGLLLPIDKGAAKKSTTAASRGDSEGDERRLCADWWAPSPALSLPHWFDFSSTSEGEGALLNPKKVFPGLQVGCVTFPNP